MTIKRSKRRRYINIVIMSNEKHSFKDVEDTIKKSVLYLYGIHGLSLIEPKLVEYELDKQNGILRCNNLYLNKMRASLAYITDIGGIETSIHPFHVSGTIKSLKKLIKTNPIRLSINEY